MAEKVPCEICACPTASKYKVCMATPACRQEYNARYKATGHQPKRVVACELCGAPCRTRYGVCTGTEECRRLYARLSSSERYPQYRKRISESGRRYRAGNASKVRAKTREWKAANPGKVAEQNRRYWAKRLARERSQRQAVPPCVVCGQPTRASSGICTRTAACLGARNALRPKGRGYDSRLASPCELCGHPTWSALGVCQKSPECKAEYSRRRLPACLGCSKPTSAASGRCPPCQLRYLRNKGAPWKSRRPPWWQSRKARHRKIGQLAACQQGLCAWCWKPLPADPDRVEIDHKIPQAAMWSALGLVIHDDWNLQVLHPRCNIDKGTTATAEAVRLASEHGLNLGMWGSWLDGPACEAVTVAA